MKRTLVECQPVQKEMLLALIKRLNFPVKATFFTSPHPNIYWDGDQFTLTSSRGADVDATVIKIRPDEFVIDLLEFKPPRTITLESGYRVKFTPKAERVRDDGTGVVAVMRDAGFSLTRNDINALVDTLRQIDAD